MKKKIRGIHNLMQLAGAHVGHGAADTVSAIQLLLRQFEFVHGGKGGKHRARMRFGIGLNAIHRNIARQANKYQPHQGKRECERRVLNMDAQAAAQGFGLVIG